MFWRISSASVDTGSKIHISHIPISSRNVRHSFELLRNRWVEDVLLEHMHTHTMLDVEPVRSVSCCLFVLQIDTLFTARFRPYPRPSTDTKNCSVYSALP